MQVSLPFIGKNIKSNNLLAGEGDMVSEERGGGRQYNNMIDTMLKNRERRKNTLLQAVES